MYIQKLSVLLLYQTNKNNMKAKFEIKEWLSENRETIIAKYEELKNEQFFNGITLKEFMVKILNAMLMNNVKSEKRAIAMLPFLMGNIYFKNSVVGHVSI